MTYITYPLPTSLNLSVNPLSTLFIYGNVVTNGFLAPVLLAVTFFVCFLTFQNQPYKDKALVASLFVVFIESVGFWAGGIIPFYYPAVCMIALGIGLYTSSRWHGD